MAALLGDGVLEVLAEPSQLSLPSDEWGLQMPRDRLRPLAYRNEPVGLDRRGLPLHFERVERLRFDGVAHQAPCLPADQHLARRRRLLESRGDVDGVARHHRLALARDDLAGVDADPELRAAQLLCRTYGPQRVVLVDDRYPEHRHHCIAGELLDRPSVALDRLAGLLEPAAHLCAPTLRIARLAGGGRVDDVPSVCAHRWAAGSSRPARRSRATARA